MKQNKKRFKGNLAKIQQIASSLKEEADKLWNEADILRDLAIDCLGNVRQGVVRNIMTLSAQSMGLSKAAKQIEDMLAGKDSRDD